MKPGLKLGFSPVPQEHLLHLTSAQLPDIKNWQPGQRYRIVLDVEQLSAGLGGPTNQADASFKVLAARPQYGGGPSKGATVKAKPDKSDTMKALQRKAGY